ncbi:cytochrome P450, partial [Hyaloscypha finlandica]
AVIQESLRLSTAIPGNLPRLIPPQGATVNGIFLPGGTSVSLANRIKHNDTVVFPSPQTFDPDRWLGSHEKWQFSFSKGPHRCIGMNLAYLEMYLCLATFFARFDMELFETDEATMDWVDHGITCLKSTVNV